MLNNINLPLKKYTAGRKNIQRRGSFIYYMYFVYVVIYHSQ